MRPPANQGQPCPSGDAGRALPRPRLLLQTGGPVASLPTQPSSSPSRERAREEPSFGASLEKPLLPLPRASERAKNPNFGASLDIHPDPRDPLSPKRAWIMVGGKRCRGRRARARGGDDGAAGRHKRRLEDPAPPVDFESLRSQLRRNRRVIKAELTRYTILQELEGAGSEEAQAKNRGLTTIYNKMGHLRRRYVRLMLEGREASKEGNYISSKLEVYKAEILITQKQLELKGEPIYTTPRILLKDILLKD